MMDVQKAIMERRSTRGFDGVPVSDGDMEALIAAALQSPSARNGQPWHIAFVKDKAVLDEFSTAFRKKMLETVTDDTRAQYEDPAYDYFWGAPLFVLISVPKEQNGPFTGVDCGIVVENLALSAWGLGLGSVIVGMPRVIFEETEEGEGLKRKMGVPEGERFVIGIVIGHNNVTKDAHPVLGNRYSIV